MNNYLCSLIRRSPRVYYYRNCRMVKIMHKASGKNVKFTNYVRIWPSLLILLSVPVLDSAQNSVRTESQNFMDCNLGACALGVIKNFFAFLYFYNL